MFISSKAGRCSIIVMSLLIIFTLKIVQPAYVQAQTTIVTSSVPSQAETGLSVQSDDTDGYVDYSNSITDASQEESDIAIKGIVQSPFWYYPAYMIGVPRVKVELIQKRADGETYISPAIYTDEHGRFSFDRAALVASDNAVVRASLVFSPDGTIANERFAIFDDQIVNNVPDKKDDTLQEPIAVEKAVMPDSNKPVNCRLVFSGEGIPKGCADVLMALERAYYYFADYQLSPNVKIPIEVNDDNYEKSTAHRSWDGSYKITIRAADMLYNLESLQWVTLHEYGHCIDDYNRWNLPYDLDSNQWTGENWANLAYFLVANDTCITVIDVDYSFVLTKIMWNLEHLAGLEYLIDAFKLSDPEWGEDIEDEFKSLYERCCLVFPENIDDEKIKDVFTGIVWIDYAGVEQEIDTTKW